MSKNDLLVKILEARYELDYAPCESKACAEKTLFDLVDGAVAGTDISRYELLQSIHDRYIVFKREKKKKERVAISQRLR